MDALEAFGRTLVVAPHPDDEVLGAGGTMARLAAAGHEVFVAVVTSGKPPAYSAQSVARVQEEARQAHDCLGVTKTFWLNLPAAQLSETPQSQINNAIGDIVREVSPTTLLVPFLGDIHIDHQTVFLSSLVAARPHQSAYPKTVLAYETLSETNWNAPYVTPSFTPNLFVDIGEWMSRKLEAMQMFSSQVREAPHERSIEALRALATLRGATIHRTAAEAFVQIRHVV